MQVSIHESKQETYRTLGDLEPGDLFSTVGNTARLQVIATISNTNGGLEAHLRHSHTVLCLNVGRGQFFLSKTSAPVFHVQKSKSTLLQWEEE